jgi:SAM-dependent methyltransferase
MTTDITHSRQLDTCLITVEPVTKVLDFGQHAYADTFVSQDQLNLSEPVFPLQVHLNPDSGMLQLGYVSNAEARYNLYSYSYTSSNSKTARDHWDEFATTIQSKYNTDGLVVEIGSNDAYLIRQFNKESTTTLGIDSSSAMCELAKTQGVDALQALFHPNVAYDLVPKYGRAAVVIANNVFNHANDPTEFAHGVSFLLDKDGIFVFEVPYWLEMVRSGRFTDMVYHEHISYFTIKSLHNLLAIAGLEIVDFDVVDYHGGSLRVVAKKATGASVSTKVAQAIAKETELGLFDVKFYAGLQKKFEQQRNAWMARFYQILLDESDAVVIGVGAAAKANTWLAWHGLNKTHLHCITDASEHKQGKYTPLSRIPILDDNEFAKYPNPYALILSWNIGEGLKQALLRINPNTRFISQ